LNKTRLHLQPGAAERRRSTPDDYTSHAQGYRFFTQPAVRTGLLWKIPPNGAYNSPFCIRVQQSVFLKQEGQQGAIPYTLPPTNLLFSLLPTPQLNVKRII